MTVTDRMAARIFALVPLLACAACLDVADGRAERDARVGQAARDGVQVSVDDGLATIRALAPGQLGLWLQAPAITVRITIGGGAGGPSPGQWEIRTENVLADAVLTAADAGGGAIPVVLIEQPVPTEKRWRVTLPEGAAVLTLQPPDAGDTAPWRFGVLGDVQEAVDRVQDIFGRMNRDPRMRFVVMPGDLTENGTREQLERFQRELKQLDVPAYATQGNHELGSDEGLFQEYYGRGSQRFAFRGVQFTLVDSASATVAPRVHGWLDGWLREGRERTHVFVTHYAPVDPFGERNGSFASRAEAGKLLGRLADGDVDVTLYGHVHTFTTFSNAGIPAYIIGGGGAFPERLDGIERFYVTFDVDPARQQLDPTLVRIDE